MVSLHFYPSFSSIPDLDDAQFHVLVNGHVDLGNFSVGKVRDFAAKEYFIRVDSVKVVTNFVPAKKGNFGFFNAIEVISAPKSRGLICFGAPFKENDRKAAATLTADGKQLMSGRVGCHAHVGDWERDMAGLSRFVESRTQENGDED
ncbi:hypothetical protein D5086_020933 [Populus alba]|uniref:Uncharacterized protein n=1 Tax=Populus alba TaxID=43335 RepID=A0ACC4BMW8_POPAL